MKTSKNTSQREHETKVSQSQGFTNRFKSCSQNEMNLQVPIKKIQ